MHALTQAALTATGYFSEDGSPAEGLMLPDAATTSSGEATRLGPLLSAERGGLGAEAVFRVGTSPIILFKSSDSSTHEETDWHRVAWNFGVAPLLWVTTPDYIRLYNAYQPPEEYAKQSPLLQEYNFRQTLDEVFTEIEEVCGRRHIAAGSFWDSPLARRIDRRSRVDNVLLVELSHLLTALHDRGLRPSLAQKLVGRCIFFQYLIHRGYLNDVELSEHFGAPTLSRILSNLDNAYTVFRWIRSTFNGDLFPIEDEESERDQLSQSANGLQPLSDFFGNFNIADGQGRLFPFRFDAIPVELISSIYEKFAHMVATDGSPRTGMHYTPINLVDLVLDPVFEGVTPDSSVLDLACGSGVFLVESLRRLTWLHSRRETLHRDMVSNILIRQIRGVDISPAALSIAAFSLYLAFLELDPSPPSGVDALSCLRFPPLRNRVLYAKSAFDPRLEDALLSSDMFEPFDIIIGNPPWTYSASEKAADRELAQVGKSDEHDDSAKSTDVELESAFSGTTYARWRGRKIPPRSSDWAFLWRCLDFSHARTRLAMVMKATPFYSLAPKTHAARDAVLRRFPNVSVVNLSQLRTSRLFQEYESWDGARKVKRRTAGPALLFLSNCLSTHSECISIMDFHWTSSFGRTGVLELPADAPRTLRLDTLQSLPGLLKASTFGTARDAWFLERLSRNSRVVGFQEWCNQLALPSGRGYRAGNGMDATHLMGLPDARAGDVQRGKLACHLQTFRMRRVNRSRNTSIFRGPLVMLPEGSLKEAPLPGRYTAVYDDRDIAYNSSFFGISFADRDPVLAQALAAVMHSRLVAYQLAFMGGTVGVKQTKIEVVDIANVRLPPIHELGFEDLRMLSRAHHTLTSQREPSAIIEAASVIDEIVESASALDEQDLRLLYDSNRRVRAIFFESQHARAPMVAAPTSAEIELYSCNVCATFNALSVTEGDHSLELDHYSILKRDFVVVKLRLTNRRRAEDVGVPEPVATDKTDYAMFQALGGHELPHITAAKALRVYSDQHVYLVKPAQYRCFSPAAGQTDADYIVSDLMETTAFDREVSET